MQLMSVEKTVECRSDHFQTQVISVSRMRGGEVPTQCCIEDEGWPLGIGVQAQVPNHLELHR